MSKSLFERQWELSEQFKKTHKMEDYCGHLCWVMGCIHCKMIGSNMDSAAIMHPDEIEKQCYKDHHECEYFKPFKYS